MGPAGKQKLKGGKDAIVGYQKSRKKAIGEAWRNGKQSVSGGYKRQWGWKTDTGGWKGGKELFYTVTEQLTKLGAGVTCKVKKIPTKLVDVAEEISSQNDKRTVSLILGLDI